MADNTVVQEISGRLSGYSYRMGELVDTSRKNAPGKKQMIKKGKRDGRPSVLQKLENYKKAKGVMS